jgi:hypothetical protein
MLGFYRVAAQLVASRVVLSCTELVSYWIMEGRFQCLKICGGKWLIDCWLMNGSKSGRKRLWPIRWSFLEFSWRYREQQRNEAVGIASVRTLIGHRNTSDTTLLHDRELWSVKRDGLVPKLNCSLRPSDGAWNVMDLSLSWTVHCGVVTERETRWTCP